MRIFAKFIGGGRNLDSDEEDGNVFAKDGHNNEFPSINELNEVINSINNLSGLSDVLSSIKKDFDLRLLESRNLKNENVSLTEALSAERQNSDRLNAENYNYKNNTERLMHALSIEKRNLDSVRTKLVDVENKKLEIIRSNEDLSANVVKLNGIVNELNIANGTLRNELESALVRREIDEKSANELKDKVIELRDKLEVALNEKDNLATQVNILHERVSVQMSEISEKDHEINRINERTAVLLVKLKRETNVANTLRSENDIFLKEREELQIKHATETEAIKKRYRLLEKMLEESRERYRTEAQIHTSTKKEKAQIEYEMSQYKSQLTASREESVELRRRNLELDQGLRLAQSAANHEAELSKKKSMEMETLCEELANLQSRQRILETEVVDLKNLNIEIAASDQITIDSLKKEVARLREELQIHRGASGESADLFKNDKSNNGNVVEFLPPKEEIF